MIQMIERLPMLMDQENQYCVNDCATKSNLQIQYKPHHNPNTILLRNRKMSSISCGHTQAQTANMILSKKNNAEGVTILDFK